MDMSKERREYDQLICPRKYVIGGRGKTVSLFVYDTFASSRCSLNGPSRKNTDSLIDSRE